MTLLPWLILIILYGACVGSFLNVVAYRLPEGRSLVRPGSQCPGCGHALAWYDNIPVLGWLFLAGRCRYCKNRISPQYPAVELSTALLFGLVFIIYYLSPFRPDFASAGLGATWPALVVHLTLVAALVAATLIDARLYIIPLQIPWFATLVALVLLPLATALGWLTHLPGVVPMATAGGIGAAFGGTIGLLIAVGLLQTNMLPRSFDELEDEIEDTDPPDAFLSHPHPRREVLKECLFVAFPLAGGLLGYVLGQGYDAPPGPTLQVVGGTILGYLIGGGLVWFTRILGTLAFGKEAMGLGDVHLMGAVGAVLGLADVTLAFFVAPFFGLAAAALMAGVAALAKGEVRVIPYGPYLAGATVVVMFFRDPIYQFLGFGGF